MKNILNPRSYHVSSISSPHVLAVSCYLQYLCGIKKPGCSTADIGVSHLGASSSFFLPSQETSETPSLSDHPKCMACPATCYRWTLMARAVLALPGYGKPTLREPRRDLCASLPEERPCSILPLMILIVQQ